MARDQASTKLSTGTEVRRASNAVTDSSGALMARIQRKRLEYNPIELLAKGVTPPRVVMEHKKKAKAGNLFFEYIQNVPQFRGYGINGDHVAAWLAKEGMVVYDAETGDYEWKIEPLSKRDFLRLFPAKGEFASLQDETSTKE